MSAAAEVLRSDLSIAAIRSDPKCIHILKAAVREALADAPEAA